MEPEPVRPVEESASVSRLKPRLSYANVVASLALFVALGGTSYAVSALPKSSVGSRQLRSNAVSSSKVKDRSLGVRDLSLSARTTLRGAAGPIGPQGPAGPAATTFFAAATASGKFVRGNATNGGRADTPGTYVVGFASSVSGCAFTATLGSTDATTAPAGRIAVNDLGGKVGVQTYDAGGNPADLPFQLIVAC